MKSYLSVTLLVLQVCILETAKATDSSPKQSNSSSEIDWRSFLVDSPDQAQPCSGQSSKSSIVDHHQPSNHPLNTDNTGETETLRTAKITKPRRRRDKCGERILTQENFLEKLKEKRIKKNKRTQRYRHKLKERIGFTSTSGALLYKYRQLEKSGEITADQQITLNDHRKKKGDLMKKYKAEKKKARMDANLPPPRIGRPPKREK